MRKTVGLPLLLLFLVGCAPNAKFIQTDEAFVPKAGPAGEPVDFRIGDIARPYKVVGVLEAQLGRGARRPELDALLLKKAREIGVDAVILVEYDVDRHVYVERHHAVVGRGPWRHHVVTSNPRVAVEKTATGLAVVFD